MSNLSESGIDKMVIILNNHLKWDGSSLGIGLINNQWKMENIQYYSINLPTHPQYSLGTIYCRALPAKDLFPCIIDELRELFGLPRRGVHRVHIGAKEY